MMKRLTCIIHGRVQGVSFRDFVSDTAATLELTGTVQNLADGTVEVIAEGGEDTLQELLRVLYTGYPPADVQSIDAMWGEATNAFSRFRVLYRTFLDRL
ncbi:MAG: acylphosphatase [Patescibacteria group bacterium]